MAIRLASTVFKPHCKDKSVVEKHLQLELINREKRLLTVNAFRDRFSVLLCQVSGIGMAGFYSLQSVYCSIRSFAYQQRTYHLGINPKTEGGEIVVMSYPVGSGMEYNFVLFVQ